MKKHATCQERLFFIFVPRVVSVFKMAPCHHVENREKSGDDRNLHARHEDGCQVTQLHARHGKNCVLENYMPGM